MTIKILPYKITRSFKPSHYITQSILLLLFRLVLEAKEGVYMDKLKNVPKIKLFRCSVLCSQPPEIRNTNNMIINGFTFREIRAKKEKIESERKIIPLTQPYRH